MKFSHWLERRDKHEVMLAINSRISNASNAPSLNQRTFIYKIELRSFERALGEFFLDFVVCFERTIQFISIVKRNYFDLVEILQYWSQSQSLSDVTCAGSHALRMYARAMEKCFIEINLNWICNGIEPWACSITVAKAWWRLVCMCENSIEEISLFLRKDGKKATKCVRSLTCCPFLAFFGFREAPWSRFGSVSSWGYHSVLE